MSSYTAWKVQLFFGALQSKELDSRKEFLEELEKEFECYEEYVVPNNNNFDIPGRERSKSDLYPVLLRLAYECPFCDVRDTCIKIIKNLEINGGIVPKQLNVGPSKFISSRDIISISSDNNEVYQLFAEAYCNNGRVSHINQLQAYHIKYLRCFLSFESHLLHGNGPLSTSWRYYIGLMGASRHNCGVLVEVCQNMFLLHQGEPKWLDGIANTPKKLQKLNTINKILAHQPWMFSKTHLEALLTSERAADSWTIPELLQAIIILVHYQTLAGFVFGCGVNPEIDLHKGYTKYFTATINENYGSEPVTPTRMKSASMSEDSTTTIELFEKIQKVKSELTPSQGEGEKLRQFKEVETKELDELQDETTNGQEKTSASYSIYIEDPTFNYEEFAKLRQQKNIDVFRAQDFNWQEHCFSFINRLYPEIGTLLDDKFDCAYNLTYYTIGKIKNADTSKFRLATWNYIHLMYGIFHDDYLYDEVNKLLEKPYKSYIKKVACFPERITFLDYWDFYTDMLPSEKVHINLLVLESRLQAALLYAARPIMQHISSQ